VLATPSNCTSSRQNNRKPQQSVFEEPSVHHYDSVDRFDHRTRNMLNRLFHILLIAMIITCPVRCLAGSCCCESQLGVAVDSGSCCCESKTDSGTKAPAEPAPKTPCDKCQCVCSGATMPDSFQLADSFHCEYLFLADPLVNMIGQPMEIVRCRGPDDPENGTIQSGRILRLIGCSLTL
jgi:hypothetical protein